MQARSADITPQPTLGSGLARSGPARTQKPVYVDLLPPCNAGCPAGENIQGYLAKARVGDDLAAWRILTADNPFPAIHGRVCYHPCETGCNRAELDEAVSIHSVERHLGDAAIAAGWQFQPSAVRSGKRVLVVGAGPSGLSAAYHLIRLGHDVTVVDAGDEPGGMMRYGIPAYRLPRDVLDAEVARIIDMGVELRLRHKVEDLATEMREGGFDAAFVAVGAHLSRRVDIPNGDAGRILDAVTFLRDVETGEAAEFSGTVAVYGGGNSAMDAARVARRMGADDTVLIYRRTRAQMPAHEAEAADAEAEGVEMHWLRTIAEMGEHDLRVEIQELDDDGRPHGTGQYETLEADTVILALGQESDTGLLRSLPGVEFDRDVVVVDPRTFMTGAPGVFAGGDAVPSERTVTVGVGHGKKAARSIDAWLRGESGERPSKHDLATFDTLNPWYFGDHGRQHSREVTPERRVRDFTEVAVGLNVQEARFEAGRCLSCGNCFECDGCLGSCPEDAIIKLGVGHRYRFDYDACTGCGTCYRQCPVHAIEMVPADTDPATVTGVFLAPTIGVRAGLR